MQYLLVKDGRNAHHRNTTGVTGTVLMPYCSQDRQAMHAPPPLLQPTTDFIELVRDVIRANGVPQGPGKIGCPLSLCMQSLYREKR